MGKWIVASMALALVSFTAEAQADCVPEPALQGGPETGAWIACRVTVSTGSVRVLRPAVFFAPRRTFRQPGLIAAERRARAAANRGFAPTKPLVIRVPETLRQPQGGYMTVPG